jgi:thiol-disulfide isomerase/thioredoxin/NTP pyrophosphatase (non-canonical NTP hydrolase)
MKQLILLLLAFSVFSVSDSFSQGYEIKVKINGLKNDTVILGHYLNKSMYPDDTAYLDKNGLGVFKGKKKLPGGLYIVYLPSTSFFEIIIDKNQKFSFEIDTSDFVSSMKVTGSEDNIIFYDFQKYMKSLKEEADEVQKKIEKAANDKEKEDFRKELGKIGDRRIDYIKKINAQHPDLFVSVFLKSTLDIDVPDAPLLADGRRDSTWQYYYYRNHFFDNFDVSDSRLLRTPLYEDKIMTYINRVIPQIAVADSINPYVDMLIEKSKNDSDLFRYMLITLFNHYAKSNIMGMDGVYVHIADKYYISQSWWSDKKFIDDLKEKVEKAKPLLIGKKAPDAELVQIPDAHFIAAGNDTALKRFPHVGTQFNLHDIKSKYIVLIFWEADCGHCKTVIPKLHEIYESDLKKRNDVTVLAISTLFGEDGKMKWIDFVNKNNLYGWVNAWNPYSYQYKVTYDISYTPQIYLLDKNKKIVAKRIAPEQIEEIISVLDKTEI